MHGQHAAEPRLRLHLSAAQRHATTPVGFPATHVPTSTYGAARRPVSHVPHLLHAPPLWLAGASPTEPSLSLQGQAPLQIIAAATVTGSTCICPAASLLLQITQSSTTWIQDERPVAERGVGSCDV